MTWRPSETMAYWVVLITLLAFMIHIIYGHYAFGIAVKNRTSTEGLRSDLFDIAIVTFLGVVASVCIKMLLIM